jgi:hypothetical protein
MHCKIPSIVSGTKRFLSSVHCISINEKILSTFPLCPGTENIQGVPELAPQRKQACADNKKDSKLTKINFLLAQITELQSF